MDSHPRQTTNQWDAAFIPHFHHRFLFFRSEMHSHSGWVGVSALRRGFKTDRSDERVPESSFSVESEPREAELQEEERHRKVDLGTLEKRISHDRGISLESLTESGRTPAVSRAHALPSYVWVRFLGRSGRVLSRKVGGSPSAVYTTSRRPPSLYMQLKLLFRYQESSLDQLN
jgi:hypothetical protein